ncbi:hypothetical protein [Actinomadura livida]|uniref:Branched-subunit amino acid ABC-type transport system permease component n=1 Tax=Actinomadura livida TaxID=79909 RepID=A0A7W7IHD1_9ACTN|nr:MULTISPECIES: hypothetical protein [Actinomadura]MBB4776986.1 branched-subunit amino acid ABC-type transport system permease component [Actinomadura catellatispora]GGT96209.1 hypothetical protein GCM10010208_19570 [Actinomadura livida]
MGNSSRVAVALMAMGGAIACFIFSMIAVTADSNQKYAVQVAILGGFGVLALATFAGSILSGASAVAQPQYRPQPVPPGAAGYPPPYPGQPQPGYQAHPGQAPPGQQ